MTPGETVLNYLGADQKTVHDIAEHAGLEAPVARAAVVGLLQRGLLKRSGKLVYRTVAAVTPDGRDESTRLLDEACIVAAWINGNISEGLAIKALRVDRIRAREIRDRVLDAGCNLAERDRQRNPL